MNENVKAHILEEIAKSIDIADEAYDRAKARYKDLGEWFGRKGGHCEPFKPHIYSQGSFRLGTVIRPIHDEGEYDLDMGCRLSIGVSKKTHSQVWLKEQVGADVEAYRIASGIKEKREEKHRCWRLKYADSLKFHLDSVPSIPETDENRRRMYEAIVRAGASYELAWSVANFAGAITDNRLPNYRVIDDQWRVSNSEGFALWFEWRMQSEKRLAERIAAQAKVAKVDKLPAYRWKSPLQRSVQLLKRHRDILFANDPDGKPASIIITTLSGRAYQGEVEVAEALKTILSGMKGLVNPVKPRVPNPVNPDNEDFADRWSDSATRHHNLEQKFFWWLDQAQQHFEAIGKERNPDVLLEKAKKHFGVSLNAKELSANLGLASGGLLKAAAVPGLSFPDRPITPQKPAGFA